MEKNRVDPEAEKARSADQEWIEMKLLTPLTADLFPEEDRNGETIPITVGKRWMEGSLRSMRM